MTKKRIFIFFLLFLGVVFAAAFVTQKEKQPTPLPLASPTQNVAYDPPRDIPFSEQPKGVNFSSSEEFDLPKESVLFSAFQMDNNAFLDFASSLSETLLFSTPSSAIKTNDSYLLSWNENSQSLLVSKNNAIAVSYNKTLSLQKKEQTTPPKQIVESFIKSVINSSFDVVVKKESLGLTDGLVIEDAEQPALSAYSFTYKTQTGEGFITNLDSQSSGSIIIDEYGVIRFFSLVLPPWSIIQTSVVTLLSYEDVLNNLKNNKGILVSLDPNTIYLSGKDPDYSSVTTTDISLIHAFFDSPDTLCPIYLIEGVTNTGEKVVYALRADVTK